MPQPARLLTLATVLATTALGAHAQDVAAGHEFAQHACKACHVVDPIAASPRLVEIGPPFREIANTSGMTTTALRAFLTSSHPKMPNLILSPQDMDDVIAYILSLRS